ncbi:integral membrane protein-like protein [Mytilinidion resinicola]|uniref:Integral membrane protein-like protein n=1 Tax=Mytilinidion resinicola TaxID=574789 RepID=A0A6A6YJC8_9PEZI|nr:integral membrane protein-like protein [Mytilinidion resinicola]KAF2808658.1 integral membrane protein-like protein [Mytilinidion resinicola]
MRPTALVPALFCAGSLVLTFLCLFAGHKRDFMENYHLVTLNTSRIGQNLLNSSTAGNPNDPFSVLFHNLTNAFNGEIDDLVGDLAKELGLEDFYSAHILDYCYGSYVPGPLVNATVSHKDIHKNVTKCMNTTAGYEFDPTAALETSLRDNGINVTLKELDWPDDIQKGIKTVHILQKVVFGFYCAGIALTFIALLAALAAIFASGRLMALVNILVSALAWIVLAIASAMVTVVIDKSSNTVNKYGKHIGVEAHRGAKFLTITWVATALVILASIAWCFECVIGSRRRRQSAYVGKQG